MLILACSMLHRFYTGGQLDRRPMLCCRYDNGVSGGVSGMDHFLAKFYPGEQAISAGNRMSSEVHRR